MIFIFYYCFLKDKKLNSDYMYFNSFKLRYCDECLITFNQYLHSHLSSKYYLKDFVFRTLPTNGRFSAFALNPACLRSQQLFLATIPAW